MIVITLFSAHLIEENGDLPVLHHIKEGASSRILWLSYELGIPLDVQEASTNVSLSASSEAPSNAGGLVSFYRDSVVELIESGAILQYLLGNIN
jgi:glutathione S-transferase